MLGNIARNSLLPCGRSALLKRYNAPQMVYVRSKRDALSSKNQSAALEVEDEDNDVDQPIKFSTSKAAGMKVNEYRIPPGDAPWYQGLVISACLAVFLGYFCILREENDIDLMISNTDLSESFNRIQKSVEDEKRLKSK